MALFSYTLGCKECGHTWKAIMEKGSKPPRCPLCAGKTQEGLSAPSINRGEAKPGITIPQSQSKREHLAADLALKGTGMGDINGNMKPGDIAAKPLPPTIPKEIPAEQRQALQGTLTPSFVTTSHAGYAQARNDPFRNRNLGLISGGNKLPRVERVSTRHLPTKGK